MRIQQLQLLKYGKFDNLSVDFPKSERDFHVIVGPNEAGKSTIREAIFELLFGMPNRHVINWICANSRSIKGSLETCKCDCK